MTLGINMHIGMFSWILNVYLSVSILIQHINLIQHIISDEQISSRVHIVTVEDLQY